MKPLPPAYAPAPRSQAPPTRVAIALTLGVVALVLAGVGWNAVWRAAYADPAPSDFPIFYQAGAALLKGGDVYAAEHRGWHFFYPPFAAICFAPFALLPLAGGASAWYAVNAAALALLFVRLVQIADRTSGRELGVWVTVAVLVNFGPLFSSLLRLQVSLLLAALLVEAFWAYRSGRSFRAGVWIALAAAIKVYPAAAALPLVVRRDARGLAGLGVGTLIAWVLVPVAVCGPTYSQELTERFARDVLLPAGTQAPAEHPENLRAIGNFAFNNQSVFAVGARWLAQGDIPPSQRIASGSAMMDVETVRIAAQAVGGAALVVLAWLAWRGGRVRGERVREERSRGELAPAGVDENGRADEACTRVDAARSGATRADEAEWRTGWAEAAYWGLLLVGINFVVPVAWHHYFVVSGLLYAVALCVWRILPRGGWRSVLLGALVAAVLGNWLHFGVYSLRGAGALLLSQVVLWVVLAGWVWGRWRGHRSGI